MARVPTIQTPETSKPTGNLPALPQPDMSGFLRVGQDAQQLARATGSVADMAQQIHVRELDEANRLRVIEATNEARREALRLTYDQNDGYTSVKGGDVMHRESGKPLAVEYDETFGNTLSDIGGRLSNDAQRQMFAQQAMQLRTQFMGNAKAYEAQEYRGWQLSVYKGEVDLGVEEIMRNPNDLDTTNNALANIGASIAKLGELQGKSANEIEVDTRTAQSAAITGAIVHAMDNDDLTTAKGLLDQYKDKMVFEDIHKVRGPLDAASLAEDVMYAVDVANGEIAAVDGAQLPAAGGFVKPVEGGRISDTFGSRGGAHNGVDIAVPLGTDVRAQLPGEVISVWEDDRNGKAVRVRYADGSVHGFAHLSEQDVKKGDTIRAGQVIAKTGNTGKSTGPHLHWTVTKDGKKVDPQTWVGGGRGGKRAANLYDFVESAEAALLTRRPNATAKDRALVRQQAESEFRLRRASDDDAKSQAEEAVLEQGYREAHSGGLTPATRKRILAIAPDRLASIENVNAGGDEDLSVWFDFATTDPHELAGMSFTQFMSKFGQRMSPAMRQKATNILIDARGEAKPGSAAQGALTTTQLLTRAAIDTGILAPVGKDRTADQLATFNRFSLDVDRRVVDYENTVLGGKRKASHDEIQQIVDSVTLDKVFINDGWFSDSQVPVATVSPKDMGDAYVVVGGREVKLSSIPAKDRALITQALVANNIQPTEQRIAEEYVKRKRAAGGN